MSVVTTIITDATLDHSQTAEKVSRAKHIDEKPHVLDKFVITRRLDCGIGGSNSITTRRLNCVQDLQLSRPPRASAVWIGGGRKAPASHCTDSERRHAATVTIRGATMCDGDGD